MKDKVITIALVAFSMLTIVLTVLSYGLVVSTKTLPSSGMIVSTLNVGVYADSACTQPLAAIDWGTISPGGSVVKTLYVKNTGNAQATLSMAKINWNPATANGLITVTWNREGAILAPNLAVIATLTLAASSDMGGITSFSVDILISGTG